MKLGTYTFEFDPDQFDAPETERSESIVKTYTSASHFSWGFILAGKEILLEWPKMTCDQYNRIRDVYFLDTTVEWDPEITKKIFHGPVTNVPFVVGKTLTGNSSGATATVAAVEQG